MNHHRIIVITINAPDPRHPHYIPTPQFPRFPFLVDFWPKKQTGFCMGVFAIFAERPYQKIFSLEILADFFEFLMIFMTMIDD